MADYEDIKVKDLVINNMSQEKFDELKAAGELQPDQIYFTPESDGASLPDQTDNAGKFLMTDGTTASWSDKPLVNNTEYVESFAVGGTVTSTRAVSVGYRSTAHDLGTVSIGNRTEAKGIASTAIGNNVATNALCAIQLGSTGGSRATNSDANTFKVATNTGNFEMMDVNGNVPRERLKNLVEVLPTEDNGYVTVKNYGNGYVEITGYTAIGTVGASTGSEVQIDLPAGYTMANANYWVNIAPTSETTMFDFKAEAKARSTTHFMVAYKNEDETTGLTAAGVYWEVRGMLATA